MAENNVDLEKCIPLPLDESELIEITSKAKDWAIMHGAAMRSKTNYNPDAVNFAPFVLFPSSVPRKEFNRALELQPLINRLMHSVAHDEEFLTKTLAETVAVDEFTKNLFNIYKKVIALNSNQPISLGILRSDLMLQLNDDNDKGAANDDVDDDDNRVGVGFIGVFVGNENENEKKKPKDVAKSTSKTLEAVNNNKLSWKQVEINTIASGFGHLGPISHSIQSYVLRELGHPEKLKSMPENNALAGICSGLIHAWKLYNKPKAIVLFIVEDITYNICDQRFHEYYIREKEPAINILRKTLTEVYNEGKLGPNRELMIGKAEAAVIYFRAGYEPGHYHSQNEWDARYLMECSMAIKCPSIMYHLAGTKKVQQALAQPEALERFISDTNDIIKIKKIFTGLYSLEDNEIGNNTYEMALRTPEKFVLKPQREGGGNNIYGLDIPDVLKPMQRVERSAWILMDLIHPPITKSYIVRPGDKMPPPLVDIVSELGIFGVIIGKEKEIIYNYQAGHMLRTKLATANEGGVASGLGALDSPYLVDDNNDDGDDEGDSTV